MTTTRPVARTAAGHDAEPLSRAHRRSRRRRAAREQWLAVVVLAVAFLVTVVLLGLQWLHAPHGGSVQGALVPGHHLPATEVT